MSDARLRRRRRHRFSRRLALRLSLILLTGGVIFCLVLQVHGWVGRIGDLDRAIAAATRPSSVPDSAMEELTQTRKLSIQKVVYVMYICLILCPLALIAMVFILSYSLPERSGIRRDSTVGLDEMKERAFSSLGKTPAGPRSSGTQTYRL